MAVKLGRSGQVWDYILGVEPTGLADQLDIGSEVNKRTQDGL